MTQAFPDRAFSGIGGIGEFAHALNYFLLGCGTVQVCTAAMLDHAIGPNIIKDLTSGLQTFLDRHAAMDGIRSRIFADCAAIASSRTRRSGGRIRRSTSAATTRRRATPQPGLDEAKGES